VEAGARLALLTLHVTERALFARRVRTHPSADERIRRLVESRSLGPSDHILFGAHQSIEVGADPYRPLPSGAWELMMTSGAVHRENHDDEYLVTHRQIDELMQKPPRVIVEGLSNLPNGGPRLRAGLDRALSGDLAAALGEWGVPGGFVGELTDKRRNVGFYTAVEALLRSEAVGCLTGGTVRRMSAALVASALDREGRW
jgi:hypothetical protein